jgi:hypothetical protein
LNEKDLINESVMYDPASKEKLSLVFKCKVTYLDAMHVTIEDGYNILMLPDTETILSIDPRDLESIEQHTPDLHRYYFKDNINDVAQAYKELEGYLKQEEVLFNMQEASNEFLEFLHGEHGDGITISENLKTKLCMANVITADIIYKLFGSKGFATAVNEEIQSLASIFWLHGMMTANLLRKKDISVALSKVPVTSEELKRVRKEDEHAK